MSSRKLTVVISQAPGKNPNKRNLEEEIASRLMISGTAEVSLVPHLYDLTPDHTGLLWLKSIGGDILVLSWLFPRASRWILDRAGVKGHEAESLLNKAEDEEHDGDEENVPNEAAPSKGIGSLNVPNRKIYAIDLRDHSDPQVYLTEIERLAKEIAAIPVVKMGGSSLFPIVYEAPSPPPPKPVANPIAAEEMVRRRWYPVIDYSRCTNCMECIDFCLFGVYGVDNADRILVEQQDNCKKGCPACSRVCPENAILFPEHKTPAIAGAEGGVAGDFKIDLSKLFGAPSALEVAVMERDVELVADGREAVGAAVGIPKRQQGKPTQRDDLDDLMDNLDSLDL